MERHRYTKMKTALVFLACLAVALGACPRIVTRAEWGARPPTGSSPMSNPVPWTVIHHGASAHCYNEADCAAMVRSYQNQHMDVNGWDDIGYSFVVGEDGNAYEGRGWSKVGAHAPGYNSISIGICTIGTFTNSPPNAAAQRAAQDLIDCGVEGGYISANYGLVGHRQTTSTECPGDAYYAVIQGWPHYDPSP